MKKLVLVLVALMAAVAIAVPGDVIHVEAEDCILGGLAFSGGGTEVIVAYDPCNGGHMNTSGSGSMTFPVAIPDGDYILEVMWQAVSWDDGAMGAYSVGSTAGTVTLKDALGDPTGVGWHSYYPAGYSGNTSPFYLDQYVGPDSAAENKLNVSGTAVWAGSPVAAYMTISGVGAGEFVFTSWDMTNLTYDCFVFDYFELTEIIPEPATIGLLSLGALAFIRKRK